eukprot:TRINITY_DN72852_c0_g1_i1.p1 TRINITY_DN72852_c0_g1~~TRINITY_DN72852_c0_g1_i1.p1  ORF type:complete len:408 (-),score=81.87 TRINITY_DN72852_c0_g1_i1:31-1254(-)
MLFSYWISFVAVTGGLTLVQGKVEQETAVPLAACSAASCAAAKTQSLLQRYSAPAQQITEPLPREKLVEIPNHGASYSVWILISLMLLAISPVLFKEGTAAFCVVVVYLACLSLVQINVKEVMATGFSCPDFLTLIHQISTAAVAAILQRPDLKHCWLVLPISLCNGLSLLFNNTALVYGGVAFVCMISALSPIFTYMLEGIRTKRELSFSSMLPVILVCSGAMLCVHGEKVISFAALFLASCGNFCRAGKSVWQQELLLGEVSALNMVFWNSCWSSCMAMVCIGANEGLKGPRLLPTITAETHFYLLMSLLCAVTLNISQTVVVKMLGAIMQSIVGNLNLVLVIVLSQALLKEDVSGFQYMGVVLLVAGTMSNKLVNAPVEKDPKAQAPASEGTFETSVKQELSKS